MCSLVFTSSDVWSFDILALSNTKGTSDIQNQDCWSADKIQVHYGIMLRLLQCRTLTCILWCRLPWTRCTWVYISSRWIATWTLTREFGTQRQCQSKRITGLNRVVYQNLRALLSQVISKDCIHSIFNMHCFYTLFGKIFIHTDGLHKIASNPVSIYTFAK